MKYIVGKLEAVALLLMGAAILYFSIAGEYQLLMNPKFRWLSVSGAALLTIMGIAGLPNRQRGSVQGIGAILFLALIILIGRPYLADEVSRLNTLPEFDSELQSQIDQSRFPPENLQSLFLEKDLPKREFTTMGVVKRLPEFDAISGFALMDSMMVCCAADMFGIGFFVAVENLDEYEDGKVFVVCGKLEKSDSPILVDNFRFGNALMSVVHEEFLLRPENTFPYDRLAAMPSVADSMDYGKLSVFREALMKTDLWEALQEEGEFTVFAPVNEGFDGIDEELTSSENRIQLREMLSNHIVSGRIFAKELYGTESLESIAGRKIDVRVANGKLITIQWSRAASAQSSQSRWNRRSASGRAFSDGARPASAGPRSSAGWPRSPTAAAAGSARRRLRPRSDFAGGPAPGGPRTGSPEDRP
jgi:hypothetical protein